MLLCLWNEYVTIAVNRNLSNCENSPKKKKNSPSGLQRDSNPWPLRSRCSALPAELWRPIHWRPLCRYVPAILVMLCCSHWLRIKHRHKVLIFSCFISSSWPLSSVYHKSDPSLRQGTCLGETCFAAGSSNWTCRVREPLPKLTWFNLCLRDWPCNWEGLGSGRGGGGGSVFPRPLKVFFRCWCSLFPKKSETQLLFPRSQLYFPFVLLFPIILWSALFPCSLTLTLTLGAPQLVVWLYPFTFNSLL